MTGFIKLTLAFSGYNYPILVNVDDVSTVRPNDSINARGFADPGSLVRMKGVPEHQVTESVKEIEGLIREAETHGQS